MVSSTATTKDCFPSRWRFCGFLKKGGPPELYRLIFNAALWVPSLWCWASYLASLEPQLPSLQNKGWVGITQARSWWNTWYLGAHYVLSSCFTANSTLRRLLLRVIQGLVIKFFFSSFRLPLSFEIVKSLWNIVGFMVSRLHGDTAALCPVRICL